MGTSRPAPRLQPGRWRCPRCGGLLVVDREPLAPPGWSCLICGRFYRADGLTVRELQPERTATGRRRAEGAHLLRPADGPSP